MYHYLEITEIKGSKVHRRIDVTGKSECRIERIEMGLLMRIDLDNFFVNEKKYDTEQEMNPEIDEG